VIRKAGEEIWGRTSGKMAPEDKETWLWNEEVQNIVKKKKVLRKEWDRAGNQDDKEKYKEAKKEAKQIVIYNYNKPVLMNIMFAHFC
jgi:hypothetical protein